jgi:putative restriction endonuclease
VADYWSDVGHSGFRIYRYRLHALSESEPRAEASPLPDGVDTPSRIPTTVQRIVRNTDVTNWVKELYNYICRICGQRLETPSGWYAEGAHIRPLGRPHDGPDAPGNVLCLCPNDHVLFDRGALLVSDELEVLDASSRNVIGRLQIDERHSVDLEQLRYHRNHRSLFGPKKESTSSGADLS